MKRILLLFLLATIVQPSHTMLSSLGSRLWQRACTSFRPSLGQRTCYSDTDTEHNDTPAKPFRIVGMDWEEFKNLCIYINASGLPEHDDVREALHATVFPTMFVWAEAVKEIDPDLFDDDESY